MTQARRERGREPFRVGCGGVNGSPTCRPSPDVRKEPVKKRCHSLPKTTPLPGTLLEEYRRCGKAGCHCTRGEPHGPYYYHRWREEGRQRRRYVKPAQLADVREALVAWRELHPPTRSMRNALADLRRRTPELDD